jgi:hypothetical protein
MSTVGFVGFSVFQVPLGELTPALVELSGVDALGDGFHVSPALSNLNLHTLKFINETRQSQALFLRIFIC